MLKLLTISPRHLNALPQRRHHHVRLCVSEACFGLVIREPGKGITPRVSTMLCQTQTTCGNYPEARYSMMRGFQSKNS